MYTGEDTKVRCNGRVDKKRLARSSIMKVVDRCILGMLVLQVSLCIIGAALNASWTRTNYDVFYLMFTGSPDSDGALRFFTWFIILSQLVPISLLVRAVSYTHLTLPTNREV